MFIVGEITMNDKICGYYLDKEQQSIVLDNNKYLLVVAGAGSGKTLTIMGKIYYLIKYQNIDPEEILCISFTRASANNLKEKIMNEFAYNIPVYTFHKLSLEILKENNIIYQIAGTDLLENIIYNFFNIFILKSKKHMMMVLNYFGVVMFGDIKQTYLKLLQNKSEEFKIMYKLIETFIRLFKCNNYNLLDFNGFLKQTKKITNCLNYRREKVLLTLVLNIYLEYQKYLIENKEVDFDDMVTSATNVIINAGIIHRYKYIIIDEYQDTSKVRFDLVKAILDKTEAKLMVVGDDFQSIYRFTGCDISLFLNFKDYFKEAKIMKIQNTYRNSRELISVAGNFVMKNKKQIPKTLTSAKRLDCPIKIIYYKNLRETFITLIFSIYQSTHKPILVLGRNNKDIFMVIDQRFKRKGDKVIYLEDKNIEIRYLTVHRSKGLEEETVILINLEDRVLGFPTKIKDDKILRFVSINNEKYLYSEERRLFYVALTRTKGYVYILTQKNNSSIFIEELLRDYKKHIDVLTF